MKFQSFTSTVKALPLLCFFITSLPLTIKADNTIDSLRILLAKDNVDSIKVKHYNALLNHIEITNSTALAENAQAAFDWAKQRNFVPGMGLGHYYLGKSEKLNGNLPRSIEHFTKAKELYYKANLPEQAGHSAFSISNIFRQLGEVDKQKIAILEAIEIAETHRFTLLLGKSLTLRGWTHFDEGQFDKAVADMSQAIDILKNTEHKLAYGTALMNKADLIFQNQPAAAKTMLLEALKIAQEEQYVDLEMKTISSLLPIYRRSGDVEKALDMAYRQLENAQETGNKKSLIRSYRQLGGLHKDFANNDKAIDCFQTCFELSNEIDYPFGQTVCVASIGLTYLENKHPKKAIPYFKKSLTYPSYSIIRAHIGTDLVKAYLQLDSLDNAYQTLLIVDSLGKNDVQDVLHLKNNAWGAYYLKMNQPAKTIQLSQQTYDYAQQTGNIEITMAAAKTLGEAHKRRGNYQAALSFLEEYRMWEDSLNQDKNIKQITSLELQNQFEKEKDILALEQKQQEAILKAESQQFKIIALAIGLLAILGFASFWNSRKKNQIISKTNAQLEQINRTKDQIFAIIGHDLRRPAINFRGIATKVNYLLQQQDFKTLSQLGEVIEKDALALNKLIDNLLSWALMQKDVMPYKPALLPLQEVVYEVVDLFSAAIEEKKLTVVNSISAETTVFADLNALQTIFRNLLDNAVKYSNKDGMIAINAISIGKEVKITVSDTGIGMASEKIKTIFLLNKNKSERGTKGEKGTGLGLHLVKELVKLNKGTIEVKSQLEEGTNFYIVLPAIG